MPAQTTFYTKNRKYSDVSTLFKVLYAQLLFITPHLIIGFLWSKDCVENIWYFIEIAWIKI